MRAPSTSHGSNHEPQGGCRRRAVPHSKDASPVPHLHLLNGLHQLRLLVLRQALHRGCGVHCAAAAALHEERCLRVLL